MSLSERERKVLEELERELYAGDASFAKRMGAEREKLAAGKASSPKRIIAGGALAIAGLAVILQALLTQYAPFGVAGFALMVIGLWLATAQFGRLNRIASGKSPKASRGSSSGQRPTAEKSSLQDRFEQRWDQRDN